MRTRWLLILAAVALSACTRNSYCLKEQPYQKAVTLPALTPVAGLKLPDSVSALRGPPAPATSVPFGIPNDEGQGQCLDQPPPLVESATPKA